MARYTSNRPRRQRPSVHFDLRTDRPPVPEDLRIRRILRIVGDSVELASVRAELAFDVRPAR